MCLVPTKVINKLILLRMRQTVEPILRILEGIPDKKLPATLVFVDFSKAFDSIDRDNMFEILKSYEVPERMLQLFISILVV